jgi:bacterioferritin
MHHYFMATGVHGKSVADEFKEHADAEREHADQIAERIQQLGGKPDMNPGTLVQRSASQYKEGESLADMIREDLIAERVVIEVYNKMIRYFGENDPTTRLMVEHILRDEEEHASDLSDLLYVVDPRSGETEGQDPGTDPLHMSEGSGNGGRQQHRTGGQSESLPQESGKRETESRAETGGVQPNQPKQRGRQQPGNQQQGGNQRQGRGPSFRPEPGKAFAGEDKPNPPGPAGTASLQDRQGAEQFAGRGSAGAQPQGNKGRGRRGRRGGRAA